MNVFIQSFVKTQGVYIKICNVNFIVEMNSLHHTNLCRWNGNSCEQLKVFFVVVFFWLQVLKQLPAKEEKVEFCSMSEKQQVLYQTLFSKLKSSTNGESKPRLNGCIYCLLLYIMTLFSKIT